MEKDLSALVFEMRRAGSKVDKAKALARAWRTIRGLSPADRRLLAREVGFEGAEDLIEGLAGKGRGVFAPAAVLEALGKMRRNEGLSLSGILADLRDPDRRDDLLVRGIDLVADTLDDRDDDDVPIWTDGRVELEIPLPADDAEISADEPEEEESADASTTSPRDFEPELPPPPQIAAEEEEATVQPPDEPDFPPDPPSLVEEASEWDERWAAERPLIVPTAAQRRIPRPTVFSGEAARRPAEDSVLDRIRALYAKIPDLRGANEGEIRDALEDLTESWARRRALVALIEAHVPDRAAVVLDLIEDLDRPMDRRWCLGALAVRGDLSGEDLERALGMVASPAARRRVERLAGW